jgi:hypothetical protein
MIYNRDTLHDFFKLFEVNSGSYEVAPTVSSMYIVDVARFKMSDNSGNWKWFALKGSAAIGDTNQTVTIPSCMSASAGVWNIPVVLCRRDCVAGIYIPHINSNFNTSKFFLSKITWDVTGICTLSVW